MSSGFLNQTYILGGRIYKIYCKTGKHTEIKKSVIGGYVRTFSFDKGEEFSVSEEMKLEEYVDLKIGDKVTIAMIGDEFGNLFFVLNHRNQKSKYYQDSIVNTYWNVKSKWNFLENLILYIRLKIASKVIEKSAAYSAMCREIQTL